MYSFACFMQDKFNILINDENLHSVYYNYDYLYFSYCKKMGFEYCQCLDIVGDLKVIKVPERE